VIPEQVKLDGQGRAVWHRDDGLVVNLEAQGEPTDWARKILRAALVDRDRRPVAVLQHACDALKIPAFGRRAKRADR